MTYFDTFVLRFCEFDDSGIFVSLVVGEQRKKTVRDKNRGGERRGESQRTPPLFSHGHLFLRVQLTERLVQASNYVHIMYESGMVEDRDIVFLKKT